MKTWCGMPIGKHDLSETVDPVEALVWDAAMFEQVFRANYSREEEPRDYLGMSKAGSCPRAWYWSYVDPEPAGDMMDYYRWAGYGYERMVLDCLDVATARQPFARVHQLPVEVRQVSREIVAHFDPRLRGHTDHESPDGLTVLDVKSTEWWKYLAIASKGKEHFAQAVSGATSVDELPYRIAGVEAGRGEKPAWGPAGNVCQMQMYIRYGHFERGVLAYVPRDVPYQDLRHHTVDLPRLVREKCAFGEREAARRLELGIIPIPLFCVDVPFNPRLAGELEEKAKRVLWHADKGEPPACTCGFCVR